MIKLENLDSFNASVQRWFSSVEEAAAEAAVGLAKEAFEEIIQYSPQYSGDFVANWKVSKNTPDTSFTLDAVHGFNKAEPFQMGDSPAMEYARQHAKWPKIRLGESIFLSNSARHDEPYAWKIELGQVALRPVNEGAEHVVFRAASLVGFNFTNIGPVQLEGLRKAWV